MLFRRIVIGVDFTDASLAAARWAALHFAPDADVVLAHVLPDPAAPSYLQPFLPPAVELTAELSAALAPPLYGGLRGLAGLIGEDRAQVYMTAGRAPDALADAAERLGADLLVVGRGARRRGTARFGATTAVRLLARTRVPTLVVPVGSHEAPTRIVAATDDRPGGEHVVEVACRLGAAFEARVAALHAIDGDVRELARVTREIASASGERGSVTAAEADDEADDEADGADLADRWLHALAVDWLETVVATADAPPVRSTAVVRFGDPAQQILAHAAEWDAGLVVIGRGGDGRDAAADGRVLPVGSTARLAAWAAPCPVLVIPPGWRGAAAGRPAERGARAARADAGASERARPGLVPPGRLRRGAWWRDDGSREAP